jgi:hypothetical protein
MSAQVKIGDRVAVPSAGIVGTVISVDPRCVDGQPCPCCDRGVAVKPDGNPNASYGVAPAECLPIVGAAMVVRGGCA